MSDTDEVEVTVNATSINATNAAVNATEEVTIASVETDLKQMPIKFTLLDVPYVEDETDFKDVMLQELKGLLAFISSKIDTIKFTDVKQRYSRRHLQDDIKQNYHFYYDVSLALSTDENPSEILINAVRDYHALILQEMQEEYYVEDFELCVPNEEGNDSEDIMFDLCSYDHQLVSIKLGTVGLPSDLVVVDEFNEETIEVYKDILDDVDGLVLSDVYAKPPKENGNIIDLYYNVDLLPRPPNQDMKSAVRQRLESDDAKGQIFNHVQNYFDTEICVTEEGRYSAEPCVSTRQQMPSWLIAVITITTIILVCTLCIGIEITRRYYKTADKEFEDEIPAFRRRQKSNRSLNKKHHRSKSYHRSHRHSDRRDERPKHHRREKRRHHRHKHHSYKRKRTDDLDSYGEERQNKKGGPRQSSQLPQQKQPPQEKKRREPSGYVVKQSSQLRSREEPKLLQIEGP